MLETTAATPARPPSRPAADGDGELDFDWRPEPLGRAVDSDRAFRWPIVIASLFIGVGVALVIRLFIASPADSAAARLDEYRAAAAALDTELKGVIDAPSGDGDAAAAFSVAVADLRAIVSEPLPGGSPIFGGGSVAELEAAHQRLISIADLSEGLADDLRVSADYRDAAEQILTLPLLPTEASADLIDPAARTLTDFHVTASAAVGSLQADPRFEAFRQRAGEMVDRLPSWSNLYLLALRRADATATADLLIDLQARADLARAELDAAVAALEDAITSESLALMSALQQAQLVD